MSSNKYIRLIVDMAVFAIGTVLTKVVQFLLMPLYTTYMTTEAYGVAELTNNISESLFPIVTFCIYEATFRYVIGSKFRPEEILTASIKVLSFSALFVAIILSIANAVFKYEYTGCLYLILYAYSLRMLVAYHVRGKGYTKLFATSGIVNALSLALFSYVFLVNFNLDVTGYLLAIAFANVCSMLFLFLGGKLYKEINWNLNTNEITKELLRYSTPLIIYNVGYWLTNMSGRFILLWNTDASTAGVYVAVIKIAAVINMLQQAFYAAFQFNTSREYESADREVYYSNIFRLYAVAILMFGSVILCMSPIFAKFTLKNEFYAARIYLPLILYIATIDCLFCFYKTMYTAYKMTKRAVPSMIIGGVVNIFVALLSVNTFGIWGICIASLLCHITQVVYRLADVRKFVNLQCNWRLIMSYLTILSIQVVLLSMDNLFYTVIACIMGIIVVGSSLIFLKQAYVKCYVLQDSYCNHR